MNPIIIIGAGIAGWTTARESRRLDTTTPVMMITADSGDFYAKPSLSNAFAQKRTPELLVTTPAAKMAQTMGVTLPFVVPIMSAARALAATLAGQPAELVFPLMPVAIKTPALPMTVSPPPTGTARQWESLETGVWHYFDADQRQNGFALTSARTARRAEQVKRPQLPARGPAIA